MNHRANYILAAAIVAALSGCATTNSGVNSYNIKDWHSLVASEKITWRNRPDTAIIELQANALWNTIYQPDNTDKAYTNLDAFLWLRRSAARCCRGIPKKARSELRACGIQ